ncbi:hypothetical protein B0T19DRAFT_58121 [Cercophora scortea]|uniref:Uncharacterized protein n=1 Tax=Cercophora scortea TaxID=314031 RepID=A0AAE0MLH6_9PEZI|nr:hypothetical protein B0T19DRAFT_58121 [Cercophora scortea]
MPEAEQTTNGDFEEIKYHTFRAVEYDRYMSWKDGGKSIFTEGLFRSTQNAQFDVILQRDQLVLVINTTFKLVPV